MAAVFVVETLAEGLLEAAFFTVAAEFLAEGTAFPALFAVALEAGTEGLAERTLFAVFAVEALAERLTEGTAFVFAAFFIELAERTAFEGAAFFAILLEAGAEGLAEGAFAAFAFEAGLAVKGAAFFAALVFTAPAFAGVAALAGQFVVLPFETGAEALAVGKGAAAGAVFAVFTVETFAELALGAGAAGSAVIILAAERAAPFLIFLVFQINLQSADVNAGKFHGHSLTESEGFAGVLTAQFLPFFIINIIVAAQRFHADHALHGHIVQLHEEAEIHHTADDAAEIFAGASLQEQTAHAAAYFPLSIGGDALSSVALVGHFQQFVPCRYAPSGVEAENIAQSAMVHKV